MITEHVARRLCAWLGAFRLDVESRSGLDECDQMGLLSIEDFLRRTASEIQVTSRLLRQADELLAGESTLAHRRADEIAALRAEARDLRDQVRRLEAERLAPVERLRPADRRLVVLGARRGGGRV